MLHGQVVSHSFDTARQRLFRVCVAYWENLNEPVKYRGENGVLWELPRKQFLELWDREMKKFREPKTNKFASVKGEMEMRQLLRLPEPLLEMTDFIFSIFEENPNMAEDLRPLGTEKERLWFCKEFPRYRIAEKV